KTPAAGKVLFLHVAEKTQQMAAGPLKTQSQIFLLINSGKHLGHMADPFQLSLGEMYPFYMDFLSGLDHVFQFFFRSQSQTPALIQYGNTAADLFYLFHIVRSVDNGGTLTVHLTDSFQDLIPALGIYRHRRLIQ